MITYFWLWIALAGCGVAQACNRRLTASIGAVIVAVGFTAAGLSHEDQPTGPYVAAKLGSREYHLGECIDAQYIHDPQYFQTEAKAKQSGRVPHRCITSTRLAGSK